MAKPIEYKESDHQMFTEIKNWKDRIKELEHNPKSLKQIVTEIQKIKKEIEEIISYCEESKNEDPSKIRENKMKLEAFSKKIVTSGSNFWRETTNWGEQKLEEIILKKKEDIIKNQLINTLLKILPTKDIVDQEIPIKEIKEIIGRLLNR